jgi:hypothetical protein
VGYVNTYYWSDFIGHDSVRERIVGLPTDKQVALCVSCLDGWYEPFLAWAHSQGTDVETQVVHLHGLLWQSVEQGGPLQFDAQSSGLMACLADLVDRLDLLPEFHYLEALLVTANVASARLDRPESSAEFALEDCFQALLEAEVRTSLVSIGGDVSRVDEVLENSAALLQACDLVLRSLAYLESHDSSTIRQAGL